MKSNNNYICEKAQRRKPHLLFHITYSYEQIENISVQQTKKVRWREEANKRGGMWEKKNPFSPFSLYCVVT